MVYGLFQVAMGTKRPFDEDIQEFIKHPKHLENGNKPDPFGEEDKHTLETSHNLGITGEKRIIIYKNINSYTI